MPHPDEEGDVDPNETLRQIREEIRKAYTEEGGGDACLVMELVEALDEWLSKGGCLPVGWSANRDRVVTS